MQSSSRGHRQQQRDPARQAEVADAQAGHKVAQAGDDVPDHECQNQGQQERTTHCQRRDDKGQDQKGSSNFQDRRPDGLSGIGFKHRVSVTKVRAERIMRFPYLFGVKR